jgi:hypothetical protein
MLYGMDCECGMEIPLGRLDLGYTTCLKCGDKVAKDVKHIVQINIFITHKSCALPTQRGQHESKRHEVPRLMRPDV